jgi:hypothetical protein
VICAKEKQIKAEKEKGQVSAGGNRNEICLHIDRGTEYGKIKAVLS